mmetsp:Transcript_53897/g.128844  ORF Transcript_53897/g.128844 Transcript_53897/m.128844 type:complete len:154 (+) Transcript_53897:1520-1981(+)
MQRQDASTVRPNPAMALTIGKVRQRWFKRNYGKLRGTSGVSLKPCAVGFPNVFSDAFKSWQCSKHMLALADDTYPHGGSFAHACDIASHVFCDVLGNTGSSFSSSVDCAHLWQRNVPSSTVSCESGAAGEWQRTSFTWLLVKASGNATTSSAR